MGQINKSKPKTRKFNKKYFKNLKKTIKRLPIKNSTNIQKGGVKLGEGGEGCIVKPHIQCSRKITGDYVSKIKRIENEDDRIDMIQEMKIHTILTKLDPKSKYFAYNIDICFIENTVSRNNIVYTNKKTGHRKKCRIDPNINTVNYIMPYAGIDIEDVLSGRKYSKVRKFVNLKFKSITKHILNGLKKLHSNYIVHHDIKPENLALRIISQTPFIRYLDFGLTENYRFINKTSYGQLFTNAFGSAPFISADKYIIASLNREISKYNKKNLLNNSIKNKILNKVYSKILDTNLQYYRYSIGLNKQTLKFPESTENNTLKKDRDIIQIGDISDIYDILVKLILNNTFLDEYYKQIDGIVYKFDIYSLGIVFFEMQKYCNFENDDFLELVRNMINTNPIKRYNINQCLKHSFYKN